VSAFNALLKALQADVMVCPGPVLYAAMIRAARDLCDKTYCWRGAVQTAPMVADDNVLELVPPAGSTFVAVMYLSFDGVELDPVSERQLSASLIDWRNDKGDPVAFYPHVPTGTLRLYPRPNRAKADAFSYQLILKPKLEATAIDETLCEEFGEVLKDGTLYELYRMPKRDWSNGELASHHRGMYRNGLYGVRDKVLRDFASQNFNIYPEPLV
jgi:hypothetical protein